MRIGADVVAIVADGAGENRAWWSAVGTRDGDGALRLAHVSHSRPVYILPDMPHIVKRLRNALDSEVIRKFGKAIIITTTEIPKGIDEHPSHARGHLDILRTHAAAFFNTRSGTCYAMASSFGASPRLTASQHHTHSTHMCLRGHYETSELLCGTTYPTINLVIPALMTLSSTLEMDFGGNKGDLTPEGVTSP